MPLLPAAVPDPPSDDPSRARATGEPVAGLDEAGGHRSRPGRVGLAVAVGHLRRQLADEPWAVDHIRVDWNAEALEAAQSYLQMGGFSRASLLRQLTSSYGDGFTKKQAQYAVKRVGL